MICSTDAMLWNLVLVMVELEAVAMSHVWDEDARDWEKSTLLNVRILGKVG